MSFIIIILSFFLAQFSCPFKNLKPIIDMNEGRAQKEANFSVNKKIAFINTLVVY